MGSGIPNREASRYHRIIRVEGNTFRVFDSRIINLYCVDGFCFTADNHIEQTEDYPGVYDELRHFVTAQCDHINIKK